MDKGDMVVAVVDVRNAELRSTGQPPVLVPKGTIGVVDSVEHGLTYMVSFVNDICTCVDSSEIASV